jgi:serine/threonine protein kinase
MLVMKHAKCNLRQYINKYFNVLSLSNKIELLVPISNGLKKIHQAGLVHGNFHPGNILQTLVNHSSTKVHANPQTWSCISDLGLRGPASDEPRKVFTEKKEFVDEPEPFKDDDDILDEYLLQEKELFAYLTPSRQTSSYEKSKIYGVLPYIAPEVLRGQKYTQSADIYAFGFIIYEVFTGHPPYHDVPHDLKLAQNICKGHRPEITSSNIPHRIMKLITSCWDSRPEDRPTAQELHNTIRGWYWRLDPEMKSLMMADDDARGIPIKDNRDNRDNRDNSGFSTPQTPQTPGTPGTPVTPGTPTATFFSTPFTTPLNTSISHAYSNSKACKSPQSTNSTSSTMSSCETNSYETHPEAIYTSRLLEFDNLPQTASWYF